MNKKIFLSSVMVVVFFSGISRAQDATDQNATDQSSSASSHHHTPSQAAIDACSGKASGDDCEFTSPRGKDVSGACANTEDGQTLFCKRQRKSES